MSDGELRMNSALLIIVSGLCAATGPSWAPRSSAMPVMVHGNSTCSEVLLLGSGELGKEVAIELQRLGCEVIACDRYAGAPAMQVAHRFHVIDMLGDEALRMVILRATALRGARD